MTKIALVGEAWGADEAAAKQPFIGASGRELGRMLAEADIDRRDCLLTNVFNLRPPSNKIEAFCGPKAEGITGYAALVKGKFVRQEFIPELDRLAEELVAANPNVIICLGNTPLWAMTGKTGISKHRGTTSLSTHTVEGFKILPTFHPAAILYENQWALRAVAVADLLKARKESEYAEVRRPRREIWIEPSLDDIRDFRRRYINGTALLSVDIETAGNQITCIGFAPTSHASLVIPFLDQRKAGRSYWDSDSDERDAWGIVSDILADRRIPKVFQNGLYDIAFLWRAVGLKVYNAAHDTMLLHHALQPSMRKGLGFLASLYADEGAWKEMRKGSTTIKRDD